MDESGGAGDRVSCRQGGTSLSSGRKKKGGFGRKRERLMEKEYDLKSRPPQRRAASFRVPGKKEGTHQRNPDLGSERSGM